MSQERRRFNGEANSIDISYVSMDSGATLDASPLSSGTAVKVIGTKMENRFATIDHHSAFFNAIILKGDITQSRGKVGTTGIEFNSSGGGRGLTFKFI
ncbi:hypothetical protein P4573_19225 [Priestia megaterium]|uniref:hypothetical protein n=1 Tax=Priestia megaterium TaxID=1404 RepID=UPI002E2406B1|nr:hypothetical protein [Priestia megaterium]